MKNLVFFALFSILYSKFAFTQSAKLDSQEFKVLKEIWGKLGLTRKNEWDFDQDPCSGEGNWGFREDRKGSNFPVQCDCTFEKKTTCRVTGIKIRSYNVSTTIPPEFSNLHYLAIMDLSYNYLRGTIPSEWANMRLSILSFRGNRLSGSFPTAVTRITTLLELNIEGNRFSGPIPKEIAELKNLNRLVLSSNGFTGQLPVALTKLTNLTYLRTSGNNYTGKIPNYISHWTKIETLHMEGCSFEGPIPSSISALTKLTDLRISDLKGGSSPFPPLEKMTSLNILDLSFNNLTGKIPSSFSQLENAEHIFQVIQVNLSVPQCTTAEVVCTAGINQHSKAYLKREWLRRTKNLEEESWKITN